MNITVKKIISVVLSLLMAVTIISAGSFNTKAEENTTTTESQISLETNLETSGEALETESPTLQEIESVTELQTKALTGEITDEETTTRINANVETTNVIEETSMEMTEEEQQRIGETNHTDAGTGIYVHGEDLPWYVKVVVKKTDESEFYKKHESYLNSWYEEDWEDEEWSDEEDWEDEDWYSEDDEDLEDEDWYSEDDEDIEDEDWYSEDGDVLEDDEEDYEYEEILFNRLGYRADSEKLYTFAASYEISLYDTLEEKEYILPEGKTVKVYLPYLKEYLGYETEIIHLKKDSTYEYLVPQLFDKNKGKAVQWLWGDEFNYHAEYGIVGAEESKEDVEEEDAETEELEEETVEEEDSEEELDGEEEETLDYETYKKLIDEENSKINIENYSLVFETGSFSEFGVYLCEEYVAKDDAMATSSTTAPILSPKTGHNIWTPVVILFGAGVLSTIAVICRKREDDIV